MRHSIADLFLSRVESSPDLVAIQFKEGKDGYKSMTWGNFGEIVSELCLGLMSLGVQHGQCTGIMANTSHLWVAADLSIQCAGAVSVPIYPTSSSGDVQHILNDSGSAVLFVQNEKLLATVVKVWGNASTLKTLVLMTPPRKKNVDELATTLGIKREQLVSFEELREQGRLYGQANPNAIQQRVANIKYQDLATIIYTSGTTGTPKGVMLDNENILSVVRALPPALNIAERDTYLSFLPLSHVFERVCGEFYWLQQGFLYTFAEGLEHLPKNMQEVEPTVMVVVPRLLEKIYSKVMSGVSGASPRAQRLIHWAIGVGKEVVAHTAAAKPIRVGLKAKHYLAEKLVFKKLRERIGRRLDLIVTGGAPSTNEVLQFFNAIGITIVEGYGLSETAAPTNVNVYSRIKIGTVGPKLSCVDVKIAEDGEILFKGPSVFKGYFKNEEQTKEVFTDGWFHTGDIGAIDEDGYLTITDRKKDLIVNSSGKNIAPQKIEAVLRSVPYVSQAVVFGDKRKTLVALLTLEQQPALEFAREKGWSANSFEELSQSKEFKRYLQQEIDAHSSSLADYERVRSFAILPEELSVESGELTATMKVKRNVLKQKYAELVEKLYREEGSLVGTR